MPKTSMLRERGKHFDPDLLDIFFNSMDDIKRIYDQFADPKVVLLPLGHRQSTHELNES